MKTSNIKEHFKQAEEDLQRSREELYRPIEDVVTFSACVFTRRALYNYLMVLSQIHAEENNDPVEDSNTIEKLVKYNSKYSKALNDIDFSLLNCKCDEISDEDAGEEDLVYCSSVDKVNYCSELSESVRKILVEKKPSLFEN
ncbi:MAG: hypothetical protein WD361_09310 [Gracilimonas sp.]